MARRCTRSRWTGFRRRGGSRPAAAATAALAFLGLGAAVRAAAEKPISALSAARMLVPPPARASEHGELEGHDFWEDHDEVLKRAWKEYGPRTPELYFFGAPFEERYLTLELRHAAEAARAGRGEAAARELFEEPVPGVYVSERLFTDRFLKDLLAELEHVEKSGIPRRRPNGMNRYGVILDQVGMEAALDGLVRAYIQPLAGMLYPELIAKGDADEHYAFTIKYEPAGDTELKKHRDASVATLNLCLGYPGLEGGAVEFFDSGGSGYTRLPKGNASAGSGRIVFRPGMVVIHRGQHHHQALPLESGRRTNLVLWLFARHDVVRIAPYPEAEQLTPLQRWSTSSGADRSKPAFIGIDL